MVTRVLKTNLSIVTAVIIKSYVVLSFATDTKLESETAPQRRSVRIERKKNSDDLAIIVNRVGALTRSMTETLTSQSCQSPTENSNRATISTPQHQDEDTPSDWVPNFHH